VNPAQACPYELPGVNPKVEPNPLNLSIILTAAAAVLFPGCLIDCAAGSDCALRVEESPDKSRPQRTLDEPRSGIVSSISENRARVAALAGRIADIATYKHQRRS